MGHDTIIQRPHHSIGVVDSFGDGRVIKENKPKKASRQVEIKGEELRRDEGSQALETNYIR